MCECEISQNCNSTAVINQKCIYFLAAQIQNCNQNWTFHQNWQKSCTYKNRCCTEMFANNMINWYNFQFFYFQIYSIRSLTWTMMNHQALQSIIAINVQKNTLCSDHCDDIKHMHVLKRKQLIAHIVSLRHFIHINWESTWKWCTI